MTQYISKLWEKFDNLLVNQNIDKSIQLSEAKGILKKIVESDESKIYFSAKEIEQKIESIEKSTINNIKQLKHEINEEYSLKENDAANEAIRNNQLNMNKYTQKKPYPEN